MFAAILHKFIFASLAFTSAYGCLSCWIMEKLATLKLGKGQAGAASQFSRGYRPGVSRILTWCYLEEGFEECLHIYVCMYILEVGGELFVNTQLCAPVCVCH